MASPYYPKSHSKIYAGYLGVRQTHPSQGVFTMAAFDIRDMGTEACPDCGAVYKVQYQELPLKDDDEFICACGHTMASWRETGMYMYTLIQEAE